MLEFLDVHHLHCVDALVFAVLGLVNVAVLALADLLLEYVVLDYLVHCVWEEIISMIRREYNCAKNREGNGNSISADKLRGRSMYGCMVFDVY